MRWILAGLLAFVVVDLADGSILWRPLANVSPPRPRCSSFLYILIWPYAELRRSLYRTVPASPRLVPTIQSDTSTTLCAPELAQMLGCWAATKDHLSVDKCASAATTLFECMRTTVRAALLVPSVAPTFAVCSRAEALTVLLGSRTAV